MLDQQFSDALRQALIEEVRHSRSSRRRRWVSGGAVVLVGASLGGSVAIASDLFTGPGTPTEVESAPTVRLDGQGSEDAEIGAAPRDATHVALSVTCLSPGLIGLPDGASVECDDTDVQSGSAASYSLPIDSDFEQGLRISADPGVRWTVDATYVRRSETGWGVNPSGETFGVETSAGRPQLLAAIASNGAEGYVRTSELDEFAAPPSFSTPDEALAWQREQGAAAATVAVYLSDGSTQVGEFIIG